MKNISILSIVVILLIFGCRKKLDINIPEGQKHIVVNGIINADSLITVSVSKSQDILDNNKIPLLEDANVKLFKDDIFVENLTHIDSGVYTSTQIPDIGANYKISVDYNNLKSVTAQMSLTNPVQIMSVDTTVEVKEEDYGDGFKYTYYDIHYKIKLTDNGNNNDYYFLALCVLNPEFEYDETGGEPTFIGYKEYNGYFDSNDPVFRKDNIDFTLDGMYGSVFTDEYFQGLEYTINLSNSFYPSEEFGLKSDEYPSIIKIKLLTVSEDIYRYITSYNLNQYTQYDPFAQPVQIYTNIENGLGLFSGYTMDVDSLVLDF